MEDCLTCICVLSLLLAKGPFLLINMTVISLWLSFVFLSMVAYGLLSQRTVPQDSRPEPLLAESLYSPINDLSMITRSLNNFLNC